MPIRQGFTNKIRRVFHIGNFRQVHFTANWIDYELKKRCEVERFQEDEEITVIDLIGKIKRFNPDLVLFHKAKTYQPFYIILREIKKLGILTACWIFDLYFGLPMGIGSRHPLEPQFEADMVFMTDGGHNDKWRKLGVEPIILRQAVHAPEKRKIKGGPKKILFIGTINYEYRVRLVNFLQETYKDRFEFYGSYAGLPSIQKLMKGEKLINKEVRGLALNKIIGNAIVVGDSVPVPRYWSNRVYEITGRGGFLIHPKVEGLDEEFKPYKEYIPYDYGNFEQLKEIIDYYWSHNKEREKIRDAGFKRCPTYRERIERLLEVCSQYERP